MLYLTCTTITSIDLAHYGVSRAIDWVSMKCGTRVKTVERSQSLRAYIESRAFLGRGWRIFMLTCVLFMVVIKCHKYR